MPNSSSRWSGFHSAYSASGLFFCMLALFALELWTFLSLCSLLAGQSLARCLGAAVRRCVHGVDEESVRFFFFVKVNVVALRTYLAKKKLTFWLRPTEFATSCKHRC